VKAGNREGGENQVALDAIISRVEHLLAI